MIVCVGERERERKNSVCVSKRGMGACLHLNVCVCNVWQVMLQVMWQVHNGKALCGSCDSCDMCAQVGQAKASITGI